MINKKIFGALGLATVLGVAGVATSVANAATAEVTYQVSLDESLSITSSRDTVAANVASGGNGSESHTLTYSSNAANGYVITATAETNTNLVSGTNSIPYASQLTSGTSGWNLTADTTVLSFSGATATVKSASGETAASATIDVTFTVSASATQPAGTYTRKVTYTIAEYGG